VAVQPRLQVTRLHRGDSDPDLVVRYLAKNVSEIKHRAPEAPVRQLDNISSQEVV